MQYSFTCPADGEVFTVEAQNDEEAVSKLMEASKPHVTEKHSDMNLSDEQAMEMIRSNLKKMEGAEGGSMGGGSSEMPSGEAPAASESPDSTESNG